MKSQTCYQQELEELERQAKRIEVFLNTEGRCPRGHSVLSFNGTTSTIRLNRYGLDRTGRQRFRCSECDDSAAHEKQVRAVDKKKREEDKKVREMFEYLMRDSV